MVHAIILAAGSSSRMNGVNKIIKKLDNGMEVIATTIAALDEISKIDTITIVTASDLIDNIKQLIDKYHFQKVIDVISGGETRTESLFLGFNNIQNLCSEDDYCLIHDGARPFIRKKFILNCINDAMIYGSAAIGIKAIDTIKRSDINNNIIETVDRNRIFYIQTPQIFKMNILKKAIKNAHEKKLIFTDDCQLLESIGEKVHISMGESSNIKITTQEDLLLANAIACFFNNARGL